MNISSLTQMNRRRKTIASTVIIVLVIAGTTLVIGEHNGQPHSQSNIPVGAFLYLWYGNATTDAGGLGSPGWNSSSYPGGGVVVDRPTAGYYVSDDNQTFQTQINEMQSAGISFAVVSWWGPFTSGESGAINKATLDLFKYLKETDSDFKVAIMVDAYEGDSNLSAASFAQDYSYVSSNFVTPFGQWYFSWENKPLLLFFNPIIPNNPRNPNFTVRSIGNSPNRVDWTFWDAPASFLSSSNGSGVNATNDEGDPVISEDGEVTVTPRIDSYYNSQSQGGSYLRFDPTLSAGLYSEQWSYVLDHKDQVKLVLIYSFNEYHERSEIEPHDDFTNSTASTTLLLNETAQYTHDLNQ